MKHFNQLFKSPRTRTAIKVLTPILGVFCILGNVSASDKDLLATTVPASSCAPVNSSHAAKVTLSNGAWVFRGNNTGTVSFYCPVPINAYTVSNNSNDNDISAYRIYYRDPDGGVLGGGGGLALAQQTWLTSRLIYRRSGGMYSAGITWSSNNTLTNATGNTTAIKANAHDVKFNALYSFLIKMYRANSNINSPTFAGVDFSFVPVP